MKSQWPFFPISIFISEVSRRNKSDNEYPVYSITNREGFVLSRSFFKKEVFSSDLSNYKIVQKGEFGYNPSRINIGSIAFWDGIEPVLVSPLYTTFSLDQSKLYPPYLQLFLKSDWGQRQIISKTRSAARNSLIFKDFRDIKTPLPPLTEQIRIVKLLSRIEALTEKRRESIRLLDELIKSRFGELFGDPLTNPKGFPIRKLSEYYISPKEGTKTGPFGSLLKRAEYEEQGTPVWTMENITTNGEFLQTKSLFISDSKYEALKAYSVIDGDILISRAGTVGKMCIVRNVEKKSIISTNLIRLRLNKSLIPEFFVALITHFTTRVARLRVGGVDAFSHMNESILDEIKFPYPALDEQRKFLDFQSKILYIKAKYSASLTFLEQLYASTSYRAFQGKVGLSVLDVSEELQRYEIEAAKGSPSIQESIEAVGQSISRLHRQMADAAKPLLQVVEAQSKTAATMAAFQPALEILKQFQPLQKQSIAQLKAVGLNVATYQKVQKEWAQSIEQWATKSRTFEEFWEEEITPENYEERKIEMYAWLREGFLIQEFDTEKRSIIFKIKHLKTQ